MSDAKERDILTKLPDALVTLFSATQTQATAKPSKRLLISLSKIFSTACAITTRQEKEGKGRGKVSLTGERAFREALVGVLDRVLDKKRGFSGADRVVRFVVEWVDWEGAQEEKEKKEDVQLPLQRLVSHLFRYYLKGFKAKDKTVRYRCVQIVSSLLSKINELDEEDHALLLSPLYARLQDKDPSVRGQAVLGLARLQEDPSEHSSDAGGSATDGSGSEMDEEEGEISVTRALCRTVKFDPSGDVRRLALLNLSISVPTLPSILTRQGDIDALTRKALYRLVLKPLPISVLGGRVVESVGRGLKDREDGVKRAAREWICNSIDDKAVLKDDENDKGRTGIDELIKLLKSLDIMGSGAAVAKEVVECVAEERPEVLDEVVFDDSYWNHLDPESAFLIKTYLLWLQKRNDDHKLSMHMPEITPLSQLIQSKFTQVVALVEMIEGKGEEEDTEEDIQELIKLAFVERELLGIAVKEDYADEIGRRVMFSLIRDMISNPLLPQDLLPPCLDVLLKISTSEQDFMRVIVEIVQNLREDETDYDDSKDIDEGNTLDEGEAEAVERRKIAAVKKNWEVPTEGEKLDVHLRCLGIFKAMLERVEGSLEDNAPLQGLLHELVIPSVKSKEPLVRYEGLMCLGLICLLDKKTAIDAFGLFTHQSQNAEGELRLKVLQTIFDILMLHGLNFLSEKGHSSERVIDFLLHSLDQSEPEAQAISVVGICKLMLSGLIPDDEVLKSLVLMYFSPETAGNQQLRQCLSYFFPVYCFSAPSNQRRMQRIVIPSLDILTSVYADLGDEEKEDMIPPAGIAIQMVDWTDPRRVVVVETSDIVKDDLVHYDLCLDIIKQIFRESKKEERKFLCQLLTKFWIPETLDEWQAKALAIWVSELKDRRPLTDAVSKNAVKKFEASLKIRYPTQLEKLDDQELRDTEAWIELQDEIQKLMQEVEEDEATTVSKKPRSKGTTKATKGRKGKKKESSSEEEQVQLEDDDEEEEDVIERPIRSGTRNAPARNAKSKANTTLVEGSSESSEEGGDEDEDQSSSGSEGEEKSGSKVESPPKPKGRAKAKGPISESEEDKEDDEEEEETMTVEKSKKNKMDENEKKKSSSRTRSRIEKQPEPSKPISNRGRARGRGSQRAPTSTRSSGRSSKITRGGATFESNSEGEER